MRSPTKLRHALLTADAFDRKAHSQSKLKLCKLLFSNKFLGQERGQKESIDGKKKYRFGNIL